MIGTSRPGLAAPSRGLVAGAVGALSLPPWGWWPLAVAGLAVLVHALAGAPARRRWWCGLAFGIGQFVVGLWWMGDFTPGAALAVVIEAPFVGLAALATPASAVAVFPAALLLAEALRGQVPFEGLPLAGLALGQAGAPWVGVAAVTGALGLVALVAAAAVALEAALRRRWRTAVVASAAVAVVTLVGVVAPDGGSPVGELAVAAVQGGGPRGFRAVDGDAAVVVERHVAVSRTIPPGTADLVLWPEDVFDLPLPVDETPAAALLAGEAARLRSTLVAGVVEDEGTDHFRNRAAVWGPGGERLGTYEKHHPVPFGEYVPFRDLVDRVADLTPIPRDARRGTGPNVLATPAGRLGVVISYEVFFADRARAAARRDADILLVPTNAASFRSSQVPTQEVAAARLRAVEIGRDVVQAAPTGYTAVVDHRGNVVARSTLGRAEVVRATVGRRTGRTLYTAGGDLPWVLLACLALAAAWAGATRRLRSPGR